MAIVQFLGWVESDSQNFEGMFFQIFDPIFYDSFRNVVKKFQIHCPLKATLATDACIGAMISPSMTGSGYVLLHHVMGELGGVSVLFS